MGYSNKKKKMMMMKSIEYSVKYQIWIDCDWKQTGYFSFTNTILI